MEKFTLVVRCDLSMDSFQVTPRGERLCKLTEQPVHIQQQQQYA